MTAPDLEIRNPKFIDHLLGHRSDSGIDGFLGTRVVEMEAGVEPWPPDGRTPDDPVEEPR